MGREIVKHEYQKLTSDLGIPFNFLTIDGENTYRSYFGRYTWLPDDSGFICGSEDGSFYYYNVAEQQLVFLDKANEPAANQPFMPTYVNPVNGLVYYLKTSREGFEELWCADPKSREIKPIYTAEHKMMHIGVEVSNDARYTYYYMYINKVYMDPNDRMEFGRIDLELGRIDRTRYYGCSYSNHLNHFILNPEYPELLLFNHEQLGCPVYDRANVMNLDTGVVTSYKQLDDDAAAHMLWTRDGKYMTVSDYPWSGSVFSVVDKSLDNKTRMTRLIEQSYGGCTHCMIDNDLKYALGDDHEGVCFFNFQTGEKHCITRTLPDSRKKHCNEAHSEITASGKIASWGLVGPDGKLGVAWMETSYFENK